MRVIDKRRSVIFDGIDVWPLMRDDFFLGAISYGTMQYRLIYNAFYSLFKKLNSQIDLLLFLEHYPFSRAICLAAKNSNKKNIRINAMQHAAYSKGKTFAYIDPVNEFKKSEIDLMELPHPDRILVMGTQNLELFKSFGYSQDSIKQTGSCRYEKTSISAGIRNYTRGEKFSILLPLSVKQNIHHDLIKAVYFATKGINNIQIIIRNHPYWNIQEKFPWIMDKLDTFHFSSQSLIADFESTHLVISSYSTVAEEALLYGLPVIQWQGIDFEGSPFAYDSEITTVKSQVDLTELILAYMSDYTSHLPSVSLRESVYNKYFSPSNFASANIAAYFSKQSERK
jgi:surface carbohydrate biosynthesis protein (TIGR04326 family)